MLFLLLFPFYDKWMEYFAFSSSFLFPIKYFWFRKEQKTKSKNLGGFLYLFIYFSFFSPLTAWGCGISFQMYMRIGFCWAFHREWLLGFCLCVFILILGIFLHCGVLESYHYWQQKHDLHCGRELIFMFLLF